MAPYTQDELEAMLADLESDLVERKESLQGDNPRKIRQAVCAFANDLPDHQRPGVVFVGADDAGAPVGLEISDELLLQLADIKTDGNILPPPTLTVDRRVLLGTPVAVVTVLPSDTPPVRHRGRIWIRLGPRPAIASAQDERILNEKRRHRDPHFDAQPVPTASVADLDLRRFEEEYLPLAVDATALAENDRSLGQRLLVRRPHRDHQSGWSLRRPDRRELRTAGHRGLSQPTANARSNLDGLLISSPRLPYPARAGAWPAPTTRGRSPSGGLPVAHAESFGDHGQCLIECCFAAP